jgi:hypothetical protein
MPFFLSPAAGPRYMLSSLGLRLGFPSESREPPASSHVKRVNHRFRVRLGFLDLLLLKSCILNRIEYIFADYVTYK